MNGYNLTRSWFNYKFENPKKVRHVHSDMYFYIVDLWNRLGQKKEFGLPTDVAMECLGIGSYNTYKKTLIDLIDFGFIIIVKDSRNQHHSKVIALSFFDKPTDKPLDKATIKATDKPTDTIYKQINKGTKKQIYKSFAHLSISVLDYEKLVESGYSKNQIDNTLESIENYKKNVSYKSLYLTAKKWLGKEPKQKEVSETILIPNTEW
jgi:hypothetical protein